jgi:hypothetical protein
MATTPLPFPQEPTGSVGPAAPLPTGTAVAHLTIERVLHEGLHNVVYLARDPKEQRLALMEYFPRALALRQPDGSVRARQAGDAIALSVGREAFVLDANTLERIDHPGLVRVLGSLQAHRTVYRAMGYIDGPTLEQHIATRGPAASAGAALRLLDQLLDALDALHRAGVVHGRVRPDQILMAGGERPVLLGMGSAGAEIAGHDAGPWDAPEQAAMSRHDRINSATDLYMAAATAWCYATGDAPPPLRERIAAPEAWDPAAALAELPEGPDEAPGTRERLVLALKAALALMPSARPQRVADLRRLLHPGAPAPTFEPSGAAPLWVGTMPDRESQWEVLERVHSEERETVSAPAPSVASAVAVDVLPRHPGEPIAAKRNEEGPGLEAAVPGAGQARRHRALWILPLLALLLVGTGVGWWLLRDEPVPAFGTTTSRPVGGDGAAAPPPQVPREIVAPVGPVGAASASVPVSDVAAPPPGPSVAAEAPAASASAAPPLAPPATPAQALAPPPAAPKAAAPAPAKRAAPSEAGRSPAASPTAPARTAARRAPAEGGSSGGSPFCSDRRQAAYRYCMQAQCAKPVWRNHPQCNEARRSGVIS